MSQSNSSLIVSGVVSFKNYTTQKLFRGVSFFCQKLTKWKGNYPRLINVSADGIATYNTERGVLTNSWTWDEVVNVFSEESKTNTITLEICEKK